jgi:arylsulfatase A-like enzyme
LTPNLDAFSKGATLFSAAESTAPFTLPSHGSVFSGNMPSIHGGIDMQTPLRSDAPLLTELLALAGWSTTAFTGGGFLSPDFGFSRGFDRYTVHDPLITSETLPKLLDSERDRLPESMSGREYEDYLRLSAAWRLKKEAVLTYLASASRSPYFLFLHTYAAHQYHPPAAIYKVDLAGSESSLTFGKGLGPISPERWRTSPPSEADTLHMRQLYDACVRHADEEFGAVMESLKESGGLKNTYVVVFSDHGEELFEHGELGHSDSLRESLLHVPLLISGPGISPSRVTDPVSLLDLAPTLFELMGLPTTELFEGTSLLEFDGSHFSPRADSAPVFSEVSHHSFFFDSLRAGDWKVVREYGAAGRGVGTPVDRLYNLAQDGAEFTDLSGEESRLLERLGRRLTENRERLDAEAEGRTDSAAELSAGTMDALGDLGYL